MPVTFCAKSDPGKVRTNNEDNFFTDPELGLFIVADGMGGHSSGEVASKMAKDVISANYKSALLKQRDTEHTQVMFGQNNPALSESANHLVSSIRIANQVIYESSQAYPQNQGMGTTVVSVLVKDKSYVVAWVGDSRVYLIRHNQIQQLSTDHSLVQEQVTKGLISADQAEKSEFKNILTRALGAAETVEIDAVETPAFDGDYILLCSDGLTRMLSDQKILEIIQKAQRPDAICEELISAANEAGGRDNVTAVIIENKSENVWSKLIK